MAIDVAFFEEVEARYAERIANLIRDGARPAVMLTLVDSFASAGIEVEIDAVAVRDRDRAEVLGVHGTTARRHGDIVFAVATPPDPAASHWNPNQPLGYSPYPDLDLHWEETTWPMIQPRPDS